MRAYDFDTEIQRISTDSVKWDAQVIKNLVGTTTDLPMWVADMDFTAPPEVIEAFKKRAEHGVFGYPGPHAIEKTMDSFYGWTENRHHWVPQEGSVTYSPGMLTSISLFLDQLSSPGDKVVIQTPAYQPFFNLIEMNKRIVVENPLNYDPVLHRYSLDLIDLEEHLKDPLTTMMIFCSPHNPAGRVWTEAELQQVLVLCDRYHVQIISDEIHADLVYEPFSHSPLSKLGKDLLLPPITCMAPSKTFNIAGEHFSLTVIPDQKSREVYRKALRRLSLSHPGVLILQAVRAAYDHGGPWLDELLIYLQGNLELMEERMSRLESISLIKPEASFISFLDATRLEARTEEKSISAYIAEKTGVALHDGTWFGERGKGFLRMNFGTQRSRLIRALDRFEHAGL